MSERREREKTRNEVSLHRPTVQCVRKNKIVLAIKLVYYSTLKCMATVLFLAKFCVHFYV